MNTPVLKRLIALVVIFFVSDTFCFAASVTVNGSAHLHSEGSHDSIKVLFERIAPTALRDSVLTDASGNFNLTIETGVYDITYSRTGFFNVSVASKALYENTTLSPVTLLMHSTLIKVPETFAKIQSAIDAASVGDTVLVASGVYNENIDFNGKNITLASHFLTTGDKTAITQTIIDAGQNGHVVKFSNGENETAVLCGFTLTNGKASGAFPDDCGGGILLFESSPTIRNMIITKNTSESGAGVYCRASDSRLENIAIVNNSGVASGGIAFDLCGTTNPGKFPRLIHSTVSNNTGDGVKQNDSKSYIVNCIITNNSGYGIEKSSGDAPNILSTLFYGNIKGDLFQCGDLVGYIITRNANNTVCDAYYNIFTDPLFVNEANGDFHLGSFSPCIGAGLADYALSADIEGIPRGALPDLGAYENPLLYPPRAPVFDTKTVTDATEGAAYSFLLNASDPDQPDELTYELLSSPQWISLDIDHRLTGAPRDADTGFNFPVVVRVYDRYDLADTLSTTIDVLNVENPPVFQTTSISQAVASLAYSDTVHAVDSDDHDTVTYGLLTGPAWLSLTHTGYFSGNPTVNDLGSGIPVVVIAHDNTGLSDTLSVKLDVIARNNVNAFIRIDTNLSKTGCQENYTIDYPGADQYFGFAVYIGNNGYLRTFRISLDLDSNRAVFKPSRSGPNIEEDSYRFNGIVDAEFAQENNILAFGGSEMTSIVEVSTDSKYRVVWAKMGGAGVSDSTGLLYQAVFKTAAGTTDTTPFSITVSVDLFDDEGLCVSVESKQFIVGHTLNPPYNLTCQDIPNDHGHELILKWMPSPDETKGMVSYYRIYRSRSQKNYETRLLSDFSDIKSLNEADTYYSILIDSVYVPSTYYSDQAVPLAGKTYYYWIQAVGLKGASEKVALGASTSVASIVTPDVFALNAPFPNPFNPTTTIAFSLPSECAVTLSVFDITGRKIKMLVSGQLAAGMHSYVWDATDESGLQAASGVYFARLAAGGRTAVVTMALVK